ncbi:MAG: hypothetical protein MUP22_06400, partial [Desulfobacterales bacterium]|nr:hypothetical protein [Desulfobacterales bacterium]
MDFQKVSGSFRDPSGFVFFFKNRLYRQINLSYKDDYDYLMASGLYEDLIHQGFLIAHEEERNIPLKSDTGYKIIQPEPIKFISYPYEWSFSQLKDAALLTLDIQKKALANDMVLKDASAYNIQFHKGHPVLIDTLSFTKYIPNQPWVAYRQFCQHFLAPLALMSFKDNRLNKLTQVFIDGVPLDLASKLLPKVPWKNLGIFIHINLHALSQKVLPAKMDQKSIQTYNVKKTSLIALCSNLQKTIQKLNWKPNQTDWANYYHFTNYSEPSFGFKSNFIKKVVNELHPQLIWDLGANTGFFSKHCVFEKNCLVVSSDFDPGAVEINYVDCKKSNITNVLPLVIDLTNPSPSIGWENDEHISFINRGPVDLVFVLALVHHLA